jgi:hypothetical protein
MTRQREPFYRLELPDDVDHGTMRSGADGTTLDRERYIGGSCGAKAFSRGSR